MSANTVTDAASAFSATNTASLAATITAASIHAAASIAASIVQRSHQRHSDAISMHQSQSACVLAPLSEAAVAEHAALAAALAASERTAAIRCQAQRPRRLPRRLLARRS